MRFTNASDAVCGWTLGFERDGRELLVAIAKRTYALPPDAAAPHRLADTQVPLVQADEFVGEPGVSAPLFETDHAHRKPACDVLLVGLAHAPAGRMVQRLDVGLRVGAMTKRFTVVGDRQWHHGLLTVRASEPVPFAVMPVGYERAFGGADRSAEPRGGLVDTYLPNPAGRGYGKHAAAIDGRPLPNTEAPDEPVTDPGGAYRPMALTPVGRHWLPRARHAGTYDADWVAHRAPFWPDDFDERYFQAAPEDQQIAPPQGGEPVVLHHLTADGHRAFHLPACLLPVTFVPGRGRDITREAVLDTLVFEPEAERFTMTWRCALALGRSVFDVKETIVGEMSEAWHRARRFPGKTYHRSLAEAVAAKRGGRP